MQIRASSVMGPEANNLPLVSLRADAGICGLCGSIIRIVDFGMKWSKITYSFNGQLFHKKKAKEKA